MTPVEIKTFARILSGENRYLVPDYQRGYTWTEKNWSDMWADLKKSNGEHFHFTGLAVLKEGAQKDKLIVDGQQRLLTCSLMICAIVERARCLGNKIEAQQFHELETRAKGFLLVSENADEGELRIIPKEGIDRNEFSAVVGQSLAVKVRESGVHPNGPVGLMKTAYEFFQKKTSEIKPNDYSSTLNHLVTRLSVGLFTLNGDDANAAHYFDTLNNRGRQLMAFDRLRNDMFLRADNPGTASEFYRKYWKGMDDNEWWTVERQNDLLRIHVYVKLAKSGELSVLPNLIEEADWFDMYQKKMSAASISAEDEFKEFWSSSQSYRARGHEGALKFFSFLKYTHPKSAGELFRAWLPLVLYFGSDQYSKNCNTLLILVEQYLIYCGLRYGVGSLRTPRLASELIEKMEEHAGNPAGHHSYFQEILNQLCRVGNLGPMLPSPDQMRGHLIQQLDISRVAEDTKRLILYVLWKADRHIAEDKTTEPGDGMRLEYHWKGTAIPVTGHQEHKRIGAFSIYDAKGGLLSTGGAAPNCGASAEEKLVFLEARKKAIVEAVLKLW